MGMIANVLKPKNLNVPIPLPSAANVFGASTGSYSATTRAYLGNEIVSAGINLIATSAAEPHIVGKRWRRNKREGQVKASALAKMGMQNRAGYRPQDAYLIRNGYYEEVPGHPLIELLNNPNPYISRGQFWEWMVVSYFLAGNAYALKARTKLGNVVAELWPLRPDQVKPIPGNMAAGEPFILHYEYTVNGAKTILPAKDVMHFKARNPNNLYEGLSPILALLPRVNIDGFMRNFLSTFFERGGAGAGANLNVKGRMDQSEKDSLRDRFKRMFSAGQFDILVTAADDVTYTPFTLNRGLRDALPKEIDAVNEARIAMVLGIPGAILGLLIGYETSSYANQRQAWQIFWDITMTPLLSDLDDVMEMSFKDEPGLTGVDEICFDLSDIKALQEDVDAIQTRARANLAAGGWAIEEFREMTGVDPIPPKNMTFLIPSNMNVRMGGELEDPEPVAPPAQIAAPADDGEDPPQNRVGRRRITEDPVARAVWDQGQALLRDHPRMTVEQVSLRVGVSDRTWRRYREAFED